MRPRSVASHATLRAAGCDCKSIPRFSFTRRYSSADISSVENGSRRSIRPPRSTNLLVVVVDQVTRHRAVRFSSCLARALRRIHWKICRVYNPMIPHPVCSRSDRVIFPVAAFPPDGCARERTRWSPRFLAADDICARARAQSPRKIVAQSHKYRVRIRARTGGVPAARCIYPVGNEHLRASITVNVGQYVFMRRPTSEVGNKLSLAFHLHRSPLALWRSPRHGRGR